MELRSVNVQDVFDSLGLVSRDTMRWIRTGSGGGNPNLWVWVLARQPDNRKTQAFYVGHLLKKFKIGDKGQPVGLARISPGERRLVLLNDGEQPR